MSFTYPQFGNPDYSGFTTEEELARRYIATSPRNSQLSGAQMYMPPGGSMAGNRGDVLPDMNPQPAEVAAPVLAGGVQKSASTIPTITESVMQIFHSRPVTTLDWVIIFILIIAAICFCEYAHDLLSHSFGRSSARAGGNFCETCGGTT